MLPWQKASGAKLQTHLAVMRVLVKTRGIRGADHAAHSLVTIESSQPARQAPFKPARTMITINHDKCSGCRWGCTLYILWNSLLPWPSSREQHAEAIIKP